MDDAAEEYISKINSNVQPSQIIDLDLEIQEKPEPKKTQITKKEKMGKKKVGQKRTKTPSKDAEPPIEKRIAMGDSKDEKVIKIK